MKSIPHLFLAALTCVLPSLSKAENPPASSVQIARIPGDLADGTPPEPEAPKPGFIVPPEDILDTKTIQQGGRTITVQEIKPIDLPPLETAPAADPDSPAVQARIAANRALHPKSEQVRLGATVYRPQNSPARTLVSYWPAGAETPVTLWSSADFSLLSGFSSFIGSDGQTRGFIMTWSTVDIDRIAASMARHGREYSPPEIPDFPAGNATFQITTGQPDAKSLASIQSLHHLYNHEHTRLLAAYQGREQARLQQEAELKAHPPQPKNLTLSYWRTETPAPATEGGDQ